MGMKWQDASEIVCGFILKKKLDPNAVNPNDLYPPYNEIIPMCRDGKDLPDIVTAVGFSAPNAAIQACEAVNGDVSPLGWIKVLEQVSSKATAGNVLERVAKDLKDGKEVDIGQALQAMGMMDLGYREMTPMSEVTEETNTWMLTGFKPIDKHLGGFPKSCLTIIAASPGVGKTSLMLKIISSMVHKHTKQVAAVFTLEMTMGQLTARMKDMDKTLTKEEKDRILLSESTYNVQEVYAQASRLAATNKLCCIAIDFADQLVDGEQSEAIMGVIYRTLSVLAKKTGVPVILISQLNRSTYTGGTPRINHIRYSGMAEAMAALIILVYNPNNIIADYKADEQLPAIEGQGYLIVGKSRFGFKEGGPGAIVVDWDGLMGWGSESHGYRNVTV
jgi:replicative DNA helicase